MGYKINFDSDGNKTLIPPTTPGYMPTTGIPGVGIIPTQADQVRIFKQCVLSFDLYTYLKANNGSLQEQIRAICEGSDEPKKQDLVEALFIMSHQNQMEILNVEGIKQMLSRVLLTERFADRKYDTLRDSTNPPPMPLLHISPTTGKAKRERPPNDDSDDESSSEVKSRRTDKIQKPPRV